MTKISKLLIAVFCLMIIAMPAGADAAMLWDGYFDTGNWVWNWDKATEKWIHPATMQLDRGYWIKVDQNCVLDT